MSTEKTPKSGQKLATILWFVAAALSLTAAIIRYTNGEGRAWAPLGAAVFLAVMGWGAWKRARGPAPR